jgi:hypothetical protein
MSTFQGLNLACKATKITPTTSLCPAASAPTRAHTHLIAGRIGGEHHALVTHRCIRLSQHAQQGVVPPRHEPHVGVHLQCYE